MERHIAFSWVSSTSGNIGIWCLERGKKSIGTKSVEYGGRRTWGMLTLAKIICTSCAEWSGALTWCSCHLPDACNFVLYSTNNILQTRYSLTIAFMMNKCRRSRRKLSTMPLFVSIHSCFFSSLRVLGPSTAKTDHWFRDHIHRSTIRHLLWPFSKGFLSTGMNNGSERERYKL